MVHVLSYCTDENERMDNNIGNLDKMSFYETCVIVRNNFSIENDDEVVMYSDHEFDVKDMMKINNFIVIVETKKLRGLMLLVSGIISPLFQPSDQASLD